MKLRLSKQWIFTTLFLFGMLLSPAVASAQPGSFVTDLQRQTNAVSGEQGAGFGAAQDPRTIAARIIQIFLSTIGILLVAYMVYGGAVIFLSGGSDDKINEGKSILRRAIAGLLIIMFSYSITILVSRLVQGDSGPCGPEDSNCMIIEEDRAKYRMPDYDNTNPFTPYDETRDPNGTRVLYP